MNLWQRGSRFTFQKRIPSDLVPVLGATPVRLALPPCGRRDAQRVAALLGGTAETLFHSVRLGMAKHDDPRDLVIRELEAALQTAEAALAASEEARRLEVELMERRHLQARLEEQADMRDRLQQLHAPLKRIKRNLASLPRDSLPRAGGDLSDDVRATMATLQAQLATLSQGTAAAAPSLPRFSEDFPRYLARKRKDLPDSKFARYTLPAAAATFIEVIGDRPLDAYRRKDLEEFAWVLARVPANRAKLRRFARLGYREAGDANAELRRPYTTLSATTIKRQYLGPIKSALDWLCEDHLVPSPVAAVRLDLPRNARPPEDRHPLSVNQVARFVTAASRRARPDDRWLPLLGFVTGCRLAELVYLQGRDVKWNRAAQAWVFDLHATIRVGGRELPRPLKTWKSKRIIALPQLVQDCGFVAWAKDRDGFIFDRLHRAKNPAGAASKRMARLLDGCGIAGMGEVFHSLRHSHKDWLRRCKVNDRTIDLQSGHALEGVAKKYGAKSLTVAEIRELSRCELPPAVAAAVARRGRRRRDA